MKYEIEIFHYIDIYKKEWKKMLRFIGIAVFITIVFGYIQPVAYKSTAIVLSPKEGSQAGSLGKYLGIPSLSIGGSSDDVIFSMLKSRRMSNDINEHFDLKNKRKFWWDIDTYIVTGGFAVEVKGSDPDLIRDIANFAINNLDKINLELQITSQKPMVKVLDTALRGRPADRNILKKVISVAFLVFLIYTLFIFFREYFSKLKSLKK
jgi:hypothetical protein